MTTAGDVEFDPFTVWLAGEKSLQHLLLLGTSQEEIRRLRAEQDRSLMRLRIKYLALWWRTGTEPPQLHCWGSADLMTR